MKKIIKLTESDLEKIIQKVLNEQSSLTATAGTGFRDIPNINPKNLKIGDGGTSDPRKVKDVKDLQKRLMDLGLLKTKSMVPTGYFGDLTQSALNAYNSQGIVKQQKGKPEPKKQTKTEPKKTVEKKYNLTPRIDQELSFIKSRKLDDKPFFVYDPKYNLLYLFGKGGTLIDYTSVVDGKAKQQKEDTIQYTYSEWCKASGYSDKPIICTAPNVKKESECMTLPNKISFTNGVCRVNPIYAALPEAERFFAKGIYDIRNLQRDPGYVGSGMNSFRISKPGSNEIIAAAIHGIPNSGPRLTASKALEAGLKKDIQSGRVPEKYLENTKAIAAANQSFGCVGVPANFIDNPAVQKVASGARLFVMGEDKDFLVQNSVDYFEKLSGNGESCVNPEALASKMSTMV
jgi:hypothetical protein